MTIGHWSVRTWEWRDAEDTLLEVNCDARALIEDIPAALHHLSYADVQSCMQHRRSVEQSYSL